MDRQSRTANLRSAERELLTDRQAIAMLRDLRRGSLTRVEDVTIPCLGLNVDRLRGVVFENVELGVAAAGSWRSRGEWRDCTITASRLDPLTFFKCRVSFCTFDKIECGHQYTPSFVESTFEDCEFRAISFAELGAQRSSFTRVRFEDVRMQRPRWQDCDFIDVVMTGRADDARFLSCDFTRTDLRSLSITGDSMIRDTGRNDAIIPASDESFMVRSDDLAAAFEDVEPEMALTSRLHLQQLREQELARGMNGYKARLQEDDAVWSARLLSDIFGIEIADARALVRRLRDRRLTAPRSRDIHAH